MSRLVFHPGTLAGLLLFNLDDFKARSPITYIKNVKTPLMLILGETDTRTPPDAGGEACTR